MKRRESNRSLERKKKKLWRTEFNRPLMTEASLSRLHRQDEGRAEVGSSTSGVLTLGIRIHNRMCGRRERRRRRSFPDTSVTSAQRPRDLCVFSQKRARVCPRNMSALTYTVKSISEDSLPACIYLQRGFSLLLLPPPRRQRERRQTVAILAQRKTKLTQNLAVFKMFMLRSL